MLVFKCKYCGKDIEYARGKGIVICSSCGKRQTIDSGENDGPDAQRETENFQNHNSYADKDAAYSLGRSLMASNTIEDYEKAIETFRSISGFKDADDKIYECLVGIEELSEDVEKRRPVSERKKTELLIEDEEVPEEETYRFEAPGADNDQPDIAPKSSKKSKKILATALFFIAACVAFVIIYITIIIPKQKHDKAMALLEAGDYDQAYALLEEVGDSDTIVSSKYDRAYALLESEDYDAAYALFEEIDRKDIIYENVYSRANELAARYEDYDAAYALLEKHGMGDKIATIIYEKVDTAMKSDRVDEAYATLDTINKNETIAKIVYDRAVSFMDTADYEKAAVLLSGLEYGESEDLLNRLKEVDEWRVICPVGQTFFFGSYEQNNDFSDGEEDIEWIVLDKDDEKSLVISKYALDCMNYNPSYTGVTWENCSIRKWLNETFIDNVFSKSEKNYIKNTLSMTEAYDPESVYNFSDSIYTKEKLFLLSIEQANIYFNYNDNTRQCKGTDYCYAMGAEANDEGNCGWWLRSAKEKAGFAAYVSSNGMIKDRGTDVRDTTIAVRPAMWIYYNIDELAAQYDKAVSLMDSGDYESAYAILKDLDYNDSEERKKQIEKLDSWRKICPVGQTFFFGSYKRENVPADAKENIEWLVLEKADNKAFVVSKYALDSQPYDTSYSVAYVAWKDCALRKWLNETFIMEAFTKEEQDLIQKTAVTTKVYLPDGESTNRTTEDKIFLLNKSEVEKYFSSKTGRICEANDNMPIGALTGWWLREPCIYYDKAVAVDNNGDFVEAGIYVTINKGIRPAMWIDLT